MATFPLLQDIRETLQSWAILLRGLSLIDNFQSFEWSGSILAGEEKRITHNLKRIPSRFLILDAQGTNQILRSETRATADFFYVKNVASTSTFTGKILLLP